MSDRRKYSFPLLYHEKAVLEMVSEKEKEALEYILYWTGKEFKGTDDEERVKFIRQNMAEANENRSIDEAAYRREF